jgi:polycomb protein EED
VYEVEVEVPSGRNKRTDGLTLRQAYVDPDKDEVYYSCVFGGRSLGRPFGYAPVPNGGVPIVLGNEKEDHGDKPLSGEKRAHNYVSQGSQDCRLTTNDLGRPLFQAMTDMQTFDGPQLLCVAGTRGVIKVIDTARQMLAMTLSGHGKDIDDLKFSPTNEWLLLSASKDESIRLWNVKNATCVAIFAGHEGHRNNILAIAWHSSGDRFVSAGMDTTVKLWNIGEGTDVHRALQASHSVKAQTWDTSSSSAGSFRTIYEQMPYFSTNKVHTDYVDCVRFVGDLVLSKSTGGTVVLWKPEFTRTLRHGTSKPTHQRLPNEVIALREFTINKCDVWYIRFDTNVDCRMLAIGNTVGEIKVWEIDDNLKKKCMTLLVQPAWASTVRMVAFSPDSKCLIASCDDATLWKWDAQH